MTQLIRPRSTFRPTSAPANAVQHLLQAHRSSHKESRFHAIFRARMSSAISPHDATAKNEAGLLSKFLGAVWNVVAYPFITHGELKWATGILSIDDDFETCTIPLAIIHNSAFFHSLSVHNANACLVCTLPYVTAKMVTDINDGFNVCSIPQEQISRVMKQ